MNAESNGITLETFNEHPETLPDEAANAALFDYTFVDTVGRIALYDDLRSAPRIIEITPAETAAYIESLASNVYEQARGAGGQIPYSVIREVSENFIHARFREIVVSILDRGNTIRFADHGPGIPSKEKAQMPGFTSAVEPMKQYIRGVGSGLPLVRDYLESFRGTITIDDNLGTGAVVTVSLVHDPLDDAVNLSDPSFPQYDEGTMVAPAAAGTAPAVSAPTASPAQQVLPMPMPGYPSAVPAMPLQAPAQAMPPTQPVYPGQPYPARAPMPTMPQPYPPAQPLPAYNGYTAAPGYGYAPVAPMAAPPLSDRERDFLRLFLSEGLLGVTDMRNLTGHPPSTVHTTMEKLQEAGLISRVGQKRALTPYGEQVARTL